MAKKQVIHCILSSALACLSGTSRSRAAIILLAHPVAHFSLVSAPRGRKTQNRSAIEQNNNMITLSKFAAIVLCP